MGKAKAVKFGIDVLQDLLDSKIVKKFSEHPGEIKNVWFPTNRSDSLKWLKNFQHSLVLMNLKEHQLF